MHRGQLSTDNTEGLVCSRNVTAEPAASAWGSSSSEISSSAGGVSWWVCVWFFWCFSLCEPGRAETVDSWPVILCCVSQTVPRWLGAFLSLSPEGSAFETSLGPHLPFLLVLSCWGMLWSYFWRSFSWLKVWQTDCWNGVFLFYSYLCQNWGWPQTVTCIVTVFFTAEVMFFCNVFEKENHKQIRNPHKQNKTPKTMAPTFLPSAINPSLISGRAMKKSLLRYGVHKQ